MSIPRLFFDHPRRAEYGVIVEKLAPARKRLSCPSCPINQLEPKYLEFRLQLGIRHPQANHRVEEDEQRSEASKAEAKRKIEEERRQAEEKVKHWEEEEKSHKAEEGNRNRKRRLHAKEIRNVSRAKPRPLQMRGTSRKSPSPGGAKSLG